jgi:hypothetical protein
MIKIRQFIFLFYLLTTVLSLRGAYAQQTSYSKQSFEQIAKVIESKYSIRIFYNKIDIDSIQFGEINIDQKLNVILEKLLEGKALNYSAYEEKIFITKGRKILTSLPDDFYNKNRVIPRSDSLDFDYSHFLKREQLSKSKEDKLAVIGTISKKSRGNVKLSGLVKDVLTGEGIAGASVYLEKGVGVTTDPFGKFTIELPVGRHELKIKSIGMKSTMRNVLLYSDGVLDIEIAEEITPLKEVSVTSDREEKVMNLQMGMDRLDIKTMKQLPMALGETDIMKALLVLPGVQTVGEGTLGLNVRGGTTSQNLILYNDAVVYNPSHLFGFFSTFNPDLIKSVDLYKSGITTDYGGRLASVLDVHSKEGNLKKVAGAGGVSPVTGRLTLEIPIFKDKSSLIIGVRSTYSDWILHQLETKSFKNSGASFYDVSLSYNHKINDKNSLFVTAYFSKDKFKFNTDTAYNYSNINYSAKWKTIFSPRLFGTFTGSYSEYDFSINSIKNLVNAFNLDYSIKQYQTKADFTYVLNSKNTVMMGASSILYNLLPATIRPEGSSSIVLNDKVQQENATESAIYIGDTYEVNPKVSIYAGIRYSFYQYIGTHDIYEYKSGFSREVSTITDTVHFNSGKPIATYQAPEPRVSLRYAISSNSSVKFSYNRMRQYIQMLSNTTAITPTDIWKLSDSYIKPQVGDQYSVGFYKYLKGGVFELSFESYYKSIQNTVDYKGGAVLLLNKHLETDIVNAQGKAYGFEFLIKKTIGKVNGWVSYTYSRSFLQTQSQYSSETVNQGNYYPSNYDKPHAFNFIGNYKFSRRVNASLNFVYSTGRPITLPVAKYTQGGVDRIFYSDRNEYRIPDYIRTDLSINLEGNHKIKKLAHSSWTLAVYNLFGRQNAYSVFFVSQNGAVNGYKLSIFGTPITTLTYNFRF